MREEKNSVKKKNLIDTPYESSINTAAEEHFLSENTYAFWYCGQSTMVKYHQHVLKLSEKLKLLKK